MKILFLIIWLIISIIELFYKQILIKNRWFTYHSVLAMVLSFSFFLVFTVNAPVLLAIEKKTDILSSTIKNTNNKILVINKEKKPDILSSAIENTTNKLVVNVVNNKESELNINNKLANNSINPDLDINLPTELEELTKAVLAELPIEHLLSLQRIRAEYGKNQKRGLASFRSIYLGVDVIPNHTEFRRVLIHEIGHVVDLGALVADTKIVASNFKDGSNLIYQSDPSLDFYNLCWQDEITINSICNEEDFVSQYAKTDAFEDFAESYLLFLENNESFLVMTKESSILAKKYDFLANTVFKNNFIKTLALKNMEENRVWDLTLVY